MRDCSAPKQLLSLLPDGVLDDGETRAIAGHLASCQDCREEHETFLRAVSALQRATSIQLELPEATRRRIAAQAASRVAARRWLSSFPVLALPARSSLLLATAVSILLALLALPIAMRQERPTVRHADIATIQVTVDRGTVRLAWSDGSRDSYTVYKSSDPRSLRAAEAHVVRGNVWIDREPARSPIVFYRIE